MIPRRLCLAFMMAVLSGSLLAGGPEKGLTKIHLGSFGNEDYGAWFRLLVEDELLSQGFKVVPEKDQSEATLAGVIIRENPANPAGAFYPAGLVRLQFPDGRVAWRWAPSGGIGNHSAPPEANRLVKALKQAIKDGTIFPENKPAEDQGQRSPN